MTSLDLSGVIIPLVTPFTDDMSAVSEVRLARIVRSLLSHQPAGFLLGGDIGEFSLLSNSERKFAVEVVLRETANAVPVLVNVTAVGSMPALDMAQHAKRHGARAAVVMPPYYGYFTSAEIQHHLKVIANYSDMHVFVVDPQKQLAPEVQAELINHAGLKFPDPLAAKLPSSVCVAETSTTDEFSIGDILCSPVALFEFAEVKSIAGGGEGPRAEKLAKAMKANGKVRLAKALLQYRELEAGPPRNPYQMSSIDVVRALET